MYTWLSFSEERGVSFSPSSPTLGTLVSTGRQLKRSRLGVRVLSREWDPETLVLPRACMEGYWEILNLSGSGRGPRWVELGCGSEGRAH